MMIDPNTLALIFLAIINLIGAVLAYKTHALARQVEIATNSMKDALVASTAKAAQAQGRREGIAEERANPQTHAPVPKEPIDVKIIPDKIIPVVVKDIEK